MSNANIVRSILAATLCLTGGAAFAQSSTGTITVSKIRTGWSTDMFAVVPVGAIINPANCVYADGYVSLSPAPGYQTFLSAALTAFALDTPVAVSVNDTACAANRPMIIGIELLR